MIYKDKDGNNFYPKFWLSVAIAWPIGFGLGIGFLTAVGGFIWIAVFLKGLFS